MNDKFLYENRPTPKIEFQNSLYANLQIKEESERKMSTKRLLRYSLAIPIIVLMLVFTISAPVRANVVNWIKQIAGFNVAESNESPLENITEVPSMITELTPIPVSNFEGAPFAFAMPQHIPTGFEVSQNFVVAESKQWISISWVSDNNYEISMLVEIYNDSLVVPAGIESTDEIMVNNQPALLIRGRYDSNSQWDDNRGLEIQWLKDGLRYDLQYSKRIQNEIVPFEDSEIESRLNELIQIAESI
jgi:hypothetical protein